MFPSGGKEGSQQVEGRGPPGLGAGQGAGPWREGKAQDRVRLTQATPRVLRSPRKGISGWGEGYDVQAGARGEGVGVQT